MVPTPEELAQILCVVPSVRRSILTVAMMSAIAHERKSTNAGDKRTHHESRMRKSLP